MSERHDKLIGKTVGLGGGRKGKVLRWFEREECDTMIHDDGTLEVLPSRRRAVFVVDTELLAEPSKLKFNGDGTVEVEVVVMKGGGFACETKRCVVESYEGDMAKIRLEVEFDELALVGAMA